MIGGVLWCHEAPHCMPTLAMSWLFFCWRFFGQLMSRIFLFFCTYFYLLGTHISSKPLHIAYPSYTYFSLLPSQGTYISHRMHICNSMPLISGNNHINHEHYWFLSLGEMSDYLGVLINSHKEIQLVLQGSWRTKYSM